MCVLKSNIITIVKNGCCRMQFDLANREAMDESAEWRLKFEKELQRADSCSNQLFEVIALFSEFLPLCVYV